MSHHHSSEHRHAFRLTVLLNAGLSGLQIVVGLAFGSIALVGDALHNLGDVAGLLLGWGAESLSRRPAKGRFSYGFGRATQLAALANAVLILIAALLVCVEAFSRFGHPEPLITGPVAWAAIAGLVVNLISARLFGSDHQHDLNRRAAVLHLLSDAAVSAAVLISTLLVSATGWVWLDPFTGLLVGLSVGWLGIDLLREALNESLDAFPARLDRTAVERILNNLPGVDSIHHLHVWALSTKHIALTAHLVRDPSLRLEDDRLLKLARQQLKTLGIQHSTLQLESRDHPCDDASCGVAPATDRR